MQREALRKLLELRRFVRSSPFSEDKILVKMKDIHKVFNRAPKVKTVRSREEDF